MLPFLDSLSLLVVAFALHVVIWRVSKPRQEVKTLAKIFALIFILGSIGIIFFQRLSSLSVFYVSIFYWVYSLIYFLTYTGLQAFGPSFIMLQLLKDADGRGATFEDFGRVITNESFIDFRISEMIQMGWVMKEGKDLVISDEGRRYLRIFTFYRKWLGIQGKGG